MPDPEKPRRPQRKPSVWSPRPIPQPAPERRTADPATPPLRELAERERQRVSLVAAPGTAAPAAPAPPQTMTRAECAAAWATVRAQTERVLNAGGGDRTPAQKLTRNRAISAAYADLARGDDRFRWAGLASVVSTQAHCAMQDADTAVGRAEVAERVAPPLAEGVARTAASAIPVIGPFVAPRAGAAARRATAEETAQVAGMAHEVQGALYDTNREIFRDIYPNVAMYKAHGIAGVGNGPGQCGGARPDRPVARPLRDALRQIDGGDIVGGSRTIAAYEQNDIVQDRIYDDPHRPLLKPAMRLNQTVSDIPVVSQAANLLMKARKPEVAISTECGQGTPVPFPGDITVAKDRVRYYDRLMGEYLTRDQTTRDTMGQVIVDRDPLRSGRDYGHGPPPGLPLRGP